MNIRIGKGTLHIWGWLQTAWVSDRMQARLDHIAGFQLEPKETLNARKHRRPLEEKS